MTDRHDWAIAIPAHDEADRLGACLAAIGRQRDVALARGIVIVLANNCSDDTASIARNAPIGCAVRVIEHDFPPGEGSAGAARRLAMDHARQSLGENGIMLTTDADCVPDDDWVSAMLACFAGGPVDLVAGRVSADWNEMQHHPAAALEVGGLEWRYCTLIAQVEHLLDPQPHDPAPRHAQQCGANIAIRAAMFDAVGGLPAVAVGEDRALIEAVFQRDGRIRHANAPHVIASARIDGRAHGGMATALRDRIDGRYVCDELVVPAAILARRLVMRQQARAAHAAGAFAAWSAQHGDGADHRADPFFGRSWAGFMARCPALAAAPVLPADLPAEIAQLESILAKADVPNAA